MVYVVGWYSLIYLICTSGSTLYCPEENPSPILQSALMGIRHEVQKEDCACLLVVFHCYSQLVVQFHINLSMLLPSTKAKTLLW